MLPLRLKDALLEKLHLKPSSSDVIRWLKPQQIALRIFDFDQDAAVICSFQPEIYQRNFTDFENTNQFQLAFKHDLRRASLDENHDIFVLAEHPANKPVAFIWLSIAVNFWTSEKYGYINNLYVAPQFRGNGWAKVLLEHAESTLIARNINKIRLTVTTSNETAANIYLQNGYRTERWEMEKNLTDK